MKLHPKRSKTPWQVLNHLELLTSFRRTTEISDALLSIMSSVRRPKRVLGSSDPMQHEGEDFLLSLLQVYCLQRSLCIKTTYRLVKIRLFIHNLALHNMQPHS